MVWLYNTQTNKPDPNTTPEQLQNQKIDNDSIINYFKNIS